MGKGHLPKPKYFHKKVKKLFFYYFVQPVIPVFIRASVQGSRVSVAADPNVTHETDDRVTQECVRERARRKIEG